MAGLVWAAVKAPQRDKKRCEYFSSICDNFFLRRVSKDVWNGSRYTVIRRAAFDFLVLSVQIHAIAIYDLQDCRILKSGLLLFFPAHVDVADLNMACGEEVNSSKP